MPALSLHLLRLDPSITASTFLSELKKAASTKVIVASRPRRTIISPTILDRSPLLSENWDILLLLQPPSPREPLFPPTLASHIKAEYKIHVGIPSRLLNTYPERDAALKREKNAQNVPLTGSLDGLKEKQAKNDGQNLEVSPELFAFMEEFTKVHDKPVTMLNLLHFHFPGGKEEYYRYGQGFNPVAAKRGGSAKLVGNVIRPAAGRSAAANSDSGFSDSRGRVDRPEEDWWNEISIVHYPSIRHFCDMLSGEDYQEVNRKYRLGALKDTFLLCTTEFDLEGESAKL
ncbi:uncharacterized protein DSM5745_08197 [Aspergillus mulundensis]|uniref:EthD domain-containing protein n=1 Tax=Aspergillus mulundensis TaxID=1810919 RepID=A0A3D8R9N1_9EURO|nr:Uncharacterized protein DSM5745_08197 [Aspergillus mulundensis]RDW70686.1 Uncharacterized protein DSM5745_08197 [Aspergillus mulundensis]